MSIESIADVVDVEIICGARATKATPPTLLVEVPHGADLRVHYDRLRARLTGALPDDLHAFFHINTDVGAWAYGRRTAELVVLAQPERSALVVRSLIPRTFIDCNRPATQGTSEIKPGALTAGIPPYVTSPDDLALLTGLHARYVEVAGAAFAAVCGNGGLALVPHTYGPRTLGIKAIDQDIVNNLRWACEPERETTWPLRAEIDLLTRDSAGVDHAPPGMEAALLRAFSDAGFGAKANDTYNLHEASLGHAWSVRHEGRVLCLEVRRDLLVPAWRPFEETIADDAKAERVSAVLAPVLLDAFKRL